MLNFCPLCILSSKITSRKNSNNMTIRDKSEKMILKIPVIKNQLCTFKTKHRNVYKTIYGLSFFLIVVK